MSEDWEDDSNLNEIQEQIDEITGMLSHIYDLIDNLREKVGRLQDAVFGDGK